MDKVSLLTTVGDALSWGRAALQPSSSAALDARLLLGDALGKPQSWVIAHPEAVIPADAYKRYTGWISRRSRAEPVAYIRGWVDWFDLRLAVGPAVLVPRLETELLVERTVAVAQSIDVRRIAEIGTGSGAIAIALARRLRGVQIDAIDASSDALRIADRNVQTYGPDLHITLIRGRLIDSLRKRPDMIVSNLPYLSDAMMEELPPDVRYEPREALHGGKTGIELYLELLLQAQERDWNVPMLFEIDPRQTDLMRDAIAAYFPGGDLRIYPDYSGRDRIVAHLPASWNP